MSVDVDLDGDGDGDVALDGLHPPTSCYPEQMAAPRTALRPFSVTLSTFVLGSLMACVAPPPQGQVTPPPAPFSSKLREPTRTWKQPAAIVIRHARVWTAASPDAAPIEDGAVLFEKGKLVQIGVNDSVTTPPGALELDATGQVLTPGVIDAHSHLGVYAVPSTFGTSDGNEATSPVTSEVDAQHGFWPQDPALRRAAAGGVTSLLVLPGSANLIGGRGFPVKLHFGRTADEVRFPGARDVLKMACGENPKRVYGQGRKSAPQTRMGNVAGYRQAFASAKEYAGRWDDFRKKAANAKPNETVLPPARDLRLETLAAVLRGEILVQNHCYKADEMQVMLDVADEFGFKIRAFHHAVEAYKVRDLLARRDVASAIWADWYGFKMESYDGIPWNAGLLQAAGARVVIHSDSDDGIQRLNQESGKALASARAAGLSVTEAQALRWFTYNPAWVLGVEEQTGSLEVGKMADLVLWDRSPLSVYARAQKVFADGVLTYDSKTGPVEPSDFEVGEPSRTWARLTPHPAAVPALGNSVTAPPIPVPEGAGASDCAGLLGATVVVEGEPRVTGLVLLRGGKIAEVSQSGAVPSGCRVLDVKGLVLAPGFIEPSTDLGLTEVAGEDRTQDASPRTPLDNTPIRAALRAEHSLNPASLHLAVARSGGVTAVLSTPGGGLVSGQSAALGTDGTLLKAQGALHLHLGSGGHDAIGSTRGAALQLLRELLDDARQYALRKSDFEKNQMRKVAASRLDLEALQEVLSGQLPVVVHANRQSDLRAALLLARDYKLRLILEGAAEAWQVAAELAQARVPVILVASRDLPTDFDSLASRPDNAALLAAAGVKVMFTSERSDLVRDLAQQAGNAVAWGLPHAEALRALSGNVADAFGLDTGHLKVGARADLVLWSGDPLEFSSRPLAIWTSGKQVPVRSRQNDLLDKYRVLPTP